MSKRLIESLHMISLLLMFFVAFLLPAYAVLFAILFVIYVSTFFWLFRRLRLLYDENAKLRSTYVKLGNTEDEDTEMFNLDNKKALTALWNYLISNFRDEAIESIEVAKRCYPASCPIKTSDYLTWSNSIVIAPEGRVSVDSYDKLKESFESCKAKGEIYAYCMDFRAVYNSSHCELANQAFVDILMTLKIDYLEVSNFLGEGKGYNQELRSSILCQCGKQYTSMFIFLTLFCNTAFLAEINSNYDITEYITTDYYDDVLLDCMPYLFKFLKAKNTVVYNLIMEWY